MEQESSQPTCFVIMPISMVKGYKDGHFARVYEYIIEPACQQAGFKPIRADEVQVTNDIRDDILRKIVEAEMMICDLSAMNPNVLYELGIRQALKLPVTLIRDSKTKRIFHIQGLRDLEYDVSLWPDKNTSAAVSLSDILKNTYSLWPDKNTSAADSLSDVLKNTYKLATKEVNSIIQLLRVKPPQDSSVEVPKDALDATDDLNKRISKFEDLIRTQNMELSSPVRQTLSSFSNSFRQIRSAIQNPAVQLRSGAVISKGTRVRHPEYGEGEVFDLTGDRVTIKFESGNNRTLDLGGHELENLQVL